MLLAQQQVRQVVPTASVLLRRPLTCVSAGSRPERSAQSINVSKFAGSSLSARVSGTIAKPFSSQAFSDMDESSGSRGKGTVKWFNDTKGFGFITPEDGGVDLFVHQTSIQSMGFRSLRDGEPVEFDVETGPDGRTRAVRVTGPGGAEPLGSDRGSYGGGRGGGGGGYGGGGGGYGGGGYGGGRRDDYGEARGGGYGDRGGGGGGYGDY